MEPRNARRQEGVVGVAAVHYNKDIAWVVDQPGFAYPNRMAEDNVTNCLKSGIVAASFVGTAAGVVQHNSHLVD